MTAVTLIVAAFFWWRANARFLEAGNPDDRRLRGAWAWALVGGGVGSFFGLAGMGGAINAAPVGALLGYFVVSNIYRAQPAQGAGQIGPDPADSPPAPVAVMPTLAPFSAYLTQLRRHLGLRGDAVFSIHANELFNPVNAGLLVGLARAHEVHPGNYGVQWWKSIEPACDSVQTVTYLMEVESGARRWSVGVLQEEYEAARKVGTDFFNMMTSK